MSRSSSIAFRTDQIGLAGLRFSFFRLDRVIGMGCIPHGEDLRLGLADVLGVAPAAAEAEL